MHTQLAPNGQGFSGYWICDFKPEVLLKSPHLPAHWNRELRILIQEVLQNILIRVLRASLSFNNI